MIETKGGVPESKIQGEHSTLSKNQRGCEPALTPARCGKKKGGGAKKRRAWSIFLEIGSPFWRKMMSTVE